MKLIPPCLNNLWNMAYSKESLRPSFVSYISTVIAGMRIVNIKNSESAEKIVLNMIMNDTF